MGDLLAFEASKSLLPSGREVEEPFSDVEFHDNRPQPFMNLY